MGVGDTFVGILRIRESGFCYFLFFRIEGCGIQPANEKLEKVPRVCRISTR